MSQGLGGTGRSREGGEGALLQLMPEVPPGVQCVLRGGKDRELKILKGGPEDLKAVDCHCLCTDQAMVQKLAVGIFSLDFGIRECI